MIRVLVALALVLGLAGVARAQDVSPGPLASDHAALEGVDNCLKCHSNGATINPASCLSCHKALGQRIAARAGFHANLGAECASCHPDHRGVGAALVRWPGGRDAFDHAKAGYKLESGHAKVKCRDCHKVAFLSGAVASALTAEERPRTYLALGTTCVTCHEDIHKPTLGTDCQRCHDAKDWHGATKSTGFDHAKTRYPLLGGHAKVECSKCHGGTPQKLAELHPKFDLCSTCHKDPHAGAMGDVKACTTCHGESAWQDLRYDRKTHAPRTLPLAGGHAPPKCAACHGDKNDRKPAATCSPCHADVHKPSLGTRCETCHQTTKWTQATTVKSDFHDRTAYALRGLHTTVKCEKCHAPTRPVAKRFRPLAHGKCLDCHADPHLGETPKPCETCHAVEDRWTATRFEVADHAKTRFVLEGAHRATPCGKCHPSAPKSPGFKAGNPACETCHADPHDAQFAGKGTCASCHGVVAWSPSTYTKEAHAKAGFPLIGKHDVACAGCHAKQFVDVATECSACHDDRHAGQFEKRACTTCHAGAEWKPAPGFDHGKTFALRGRHAKAECARCHPDARIQPTAGKPFVTAVYKLGKDSRTCEGCHRPQHGDPTSDLDQRRRLAAATRDCSTCHTESTWRQSVTPPRFDHLTTGAPLVGGHAQTACSSCHQPGRRALAHLADCESCHQDRHGGRLGERCESCHSPASWKQDQLLVAHQRTRLPLVGAHAVQGCPTCHKDAQAGTYRGLDPACRGCHLHTLDEQHPHPDHKRDNAFNACETCHSPLGWRPSTFNHDQFFPLTGKHQAPTACGPACHAPGQPYAAAPTRCVGCHQPSVREADLKVAGHQFFGSDCGHCHDATSWLSFNHGAVSAIPVGHGRAPSCATCHPTPDARMFTCLPGTCHPQATIDSRHRNVGGYMYVSEQCLRCHGSARGGA